MRTLFFLVLALVLSGCGISGNQVADEPITQSAREVIDEVLQSNRDLKAFQGTGTLTIETPDQGQRLNCRIYYNSHDTVKMEVNTGFGYGILNLWLTPDSIFISNRLSNQFISSTYRSDELVRLLHFPFKYTDIQTLFLGKVILNSAMQLTRVMNEPENFVYSYRGPEGSEKIWISKLLKKPTRIVRNNRRGEVLLDISFLRYKPVNEDQLAHQIQIYRPAQKEKLSLFFSQIGSFEKEELKILVPEKMERVRL